MKEQYLLVLVRGIG